MDHNDREAMKLANQDEGPEDEEDEEPKKV